MIVGGRTFNDSALALGGIVSVGLSNPGTQIMHGLNNTANEWIGQINASDSNWDFWPVWVYSCNNTAGGARGRLPDVSLVVSGPSIGARCS